MTTKILICKKEALDEMKKTKEDYIFGINPVTEAILSGKEIERILVKRDAKGDGMDQLIGLIKKHRLPYQFVPLQKLQRITRKNHQGVVAYLSPIEFIDIENFIPQIFEQRKNPFLVILDRVTDVRNFGSVSRVAECAGADMIIIPVKESAQVNSEAVKTSSGALNYLPVGRTFDLKRTCLFLKNSGIRLIAATEKASFKYTEIDYHEPTAIVMGSEYKGVSPKLLELADQKVTIPVRGQIDSLNVSAAAAVIMYEVVRQRLL